jgi:hypothetical protein
MQVNIRMLNLKVFLIGYYLYTKKTRYQKHAIQRHRILSYIL